MRRLDNNSAVSEARQREEKYYSAEFSLKELKFAYQFRIQSIPTLVIFKNGREMARQSGAMDLNNLLRWIQTYS